ncbi:MAG: toll/interleukin-1 receptor domain-containing protein [Chloroflexota bacterium]
MRVAYDYLRREFSNVHVEILSSIGDWELVEDEDERNRMRRNYTDLVNYKTEEYAYMRNLPVFSSVRRRGIDELNQIVDSFGQFSLFVVLKENFYSSSAEETLKKALKDGPWETITLSELYYQITGEKNALENLYSVLPEIIEVIRNQQQTELITSVPVQVFISYKRENIDVVKRMQEMIVSSEIELWTDEHLKPGTSDWNVAIEEQIEISDCIVLIMTPEAKGSKWVRRELMYGQQLEVPIIPFWVKGEDRKVNMLNIVTTQRVDARDPNKFKEAIAELTDAIQSYKTTE